MEDKTNFWMSNGGRIVVIAICYVITFGIILCEPETLAPILALVCACFGWKALNQIQPAMFLWMSWIGWIVYFLIKFVISYIIGLFIAPYKVGNSIANKIQS